MARDLKIICINMNRFIIFLFCLVSLAFIHCNPENTNYSSPPGYDLLKPYQYKLPLDLDEISGVSFYPKDSSIFAINDEKGWLYKIKIGGPKKEIAHWEFANGADFEDVVMVDSIFYVLQSHGSIIKVSFDQSGNILPSRKFPFPFGVENEFEILYYDESKRKLILICKDCDADKKSSLTTYSFDPVTDRFSEGSFSISVDSIAKLLGVTKFRFKPSAASINPADSSLYIVSAINRLLVVTDRDGHIKKVYRIAHSLFKQPEGITFTPWGTMIISNEAADIGVADILIFSRRKI
jgi:uncharacterized protein YjiK